MTAINLMYSYFGFLILLALIIAVKYRNKLIKLIAYENGLFLLFLFFSGMIFLICEPTVSGEPFYDSIGYFIWSIAYVYPPILFISLIGVVLIKLRKSE